MFVETWQEIKNSDNFLLASHKNPDCDTLGSTLSLYLVLKNLGKKVTLFNSTEVLPRRYSFLPCYNEIQNQINAKFDIVITCDCASFERTGLKKGNFKIVNIDHHATNKGFGDINLVKKTSSSVSMVVYELLKQNSIEITKDIATLLYAGIVEDTGYFTYGNIDEKTFINVADVVRRGADINLVSSSLNQSVPLARFRLHQYVMQNVDLLKNGKVARTIIMQDDLKRTGAKREDTEDIANLIRDLVNVEFAIMILEEDSGEFKVSLRGKNSIDVSSIALKFNGGGHFGAAGFESSELDVDILTKKILDEYEKGLKV
ncbi:MAG: DHH family phosphoesterase [Campylobacteraceae bacterium]